MISTRASGLSQYAKAVTQAVGGNRVTVSFPSLKRDWDEREKAFPETFPVPYFAHNLKHHKVSIQQKSVFNLNAHLFNSKSQAMSGIGGTLLSPTVFPF